MKVEVKPGDGLLRFIKVEVPSEKVQSEIEKRYEEVRKEATVDGFRKGKVPMQRIKEMYGDQVKAEIVEALIKGTYPDVVRDESLKVAALPTVTEVDFTDDGGFFYKAEVEVFPEIDQVDYDGLEITIPKVEVADKDVDDFVEGMRKKLAEQRVVDRAIEPGDIVTADVVKLEDSKSVLPESEFAGQQIDLDNQGTVAEFREKLPGLTAGDQTEITVVYAEDYQDERFAGATVKYQVKVVEVKERILPTFDDAFAKATGQAETALELRLKVRGELQQRIEQGQERQKRGQLIDQLCAKNEIPVPNAFVDNYLEKVTDDFKKRYKDVKEDDIRENYRDVGIKTIRWNLLYNRLSELEKIEVLPSDTENRIKHFAESYQMSMEDAQKALRESGNANDIRDSIMEEKVLDFLSERAKVSYTEQEQQNS